MDDILITSNNDKKIKNLIDMLNSKFELHNIGDLGYFLGIQVIRDKKKCFYLKSKYL